MIKSKKIIVIADDFTGAAEIGGIALRNGLKVAIEMEPVYSEENDIIIIATDTRSMNPDDASNHIRSLAGRVMEIEPEIVYKKIDSVLRGNITTELVAQMDEMGKDRAIVVAGNPEFKRIVKNGRYYIDNIPLHQTKFSEDSQYPLTSNNIVEILKTELKIPIVSRKSDQELPSEGIIAGDVENLEDLHSWALKSNSETLMAGAFGFFDAILKSLNINREISDREIIPFGESRLFIFGSSFQKDESLIKKMIQQGYIHSNMPEEIYYNKMHNPALIYDWAKEITNKIKENKKVIISSIHKKSDELNIAFRIKKVIAQVVKEAFLKEPVNEILIEGGSTTFEILDSLNIKKLIPIQELDTGVIRMKIDQFQGVCLTTKPGSYHWPASVWMNEKEDMNNKQSLSNLPMHE